MYSLSNLCSKQLEAFFDVLLKLLSFKDLQPRHVEASLQTRHRHLLGPLLLPLAHLFVLPLTRFTNGEETMWGCLHLLVMDILRARRSDSWLEHDLPKHRRGGTLNNTILSQSLLLRGSLEANRSSGFVHVLTPFAPHVLLFLGLHLPAGGLSLRLRLRLLRLVRVLHGGPPRRPA